MCDWRFYSTADADFFLVGSQAAKPINKEA